MNSSNIEAFLAIIDSQSVSRASERLFLSQSTVSHRLKMLEEEVGCLLVERTQGQRDCVLTPQGEAFLPLAQRWAALSQVMDNFQDLAFSSTLTIGAADSLNQCFLYGFYNQLLDAQLPFRLNLKTYGNMILYTNMANNLVDVAFAVEHIRNKAIKTRVLFYERMVLVCRPGQYHPGPIHPHELDPADEIAISWDMREMQLWHDQWFSPSAECYVTINAPAFAPHFFRPEAVWVIVPISAGLYFQQEYGMEMHELQFPPPKRICYKLTPRYPRADRLKPMEIFNQHLDAYLDQMDWLERAPQAEENELEDG